MIDRLSRRQRQSVLLVYWEGLTQEEAATEMGISQQAVNEYEKAGLARIKIFLSDPVKSSLRGVQLVEGNIEDCEASAANTRFCGGVEKFFAQNRPPQTLT